MSEKIWQAPLPGFDEAAADCARKRWGEIAKPLGSLGKLEDVVTRIAGITGHADYAIDKRAVLMLCADNGVVRRGVTQTGSEVTLQLAKSAAAGRLTINKMAAVARADVIPVDMGMCQRVQADGLVQRHLADGTADMTEGPAMSRQMAEEAVNIGVQLVADAKQQGYKILCTGEAGIGNTTTSSAVAAVLLDKQVEEVTGRGAGLSSAGLQRKIEAIQKAIEVNKPDKDDALDVLAKLGGFDIAGLCGVLLGGALHRVPILVDGFIASVAALCALRLAPGAKHAMLASHISAEPAGAMVLDALGLSPLICAGMRVGEGTGAVAALPLLDMAYTVYNEMPTFAEIEVEQYQPLQ